MPQAERRDHEGCGAAAALAEVKGKPETVGQAGGCQVLGASHGKGDEDSGCHSRKAHHRLSQAAPPPHTSTAAFAAFLCLHSDPPQAIPPNIIYFYCYFKHHGYLSAVMLLKHNLVKCTWSVKFVDVYLVLTAKLSADLLS